MINKNSTSFEITEYFREEVSKSMIPFIREYSKEMNLEYKWGYNIKFSFLLKKNNIVLLISYNTKDDRIYSYFNVKEKKITVYNLISLYNDSSYEPSNLQPKEWVFGDAIKNNIMYIKKFVSLISNDSLLI